MQNLVGGLIGLVLLLLGIGAVVAVALWAFANLGMLFMIFIGLIALFLLIALISWFFEGVGNIIATKSAYEIIGYLLLAASAVFGVSFLITENPYHVAIALVALVSGNILADKDSEKS